MGGTNNHPEREKRAAEIITKAEKNLDGTL